MTDIDRTQHERLVEEKLEFHSQQLDDVQDNVKANRNAIRRITRDVQQVVSDLRDHEKAKRYHLGTMFGALGPILVAIAEILRRFGLL